MKILLIVENYCKREVKEKRGDIDNKNKNISEKRKKRKIGKKRKKGRKREEKEKDREKKKERRKKRKKRKIGKRGKLFR